MRFLPDFLGGGWSLDRVAPPWGRRPSIYAHLAAHVRPDGPGLAAAGERLPDEEPADGSKLRWAPGALDGVLGHHMEGDAAEDVAGRVLEALRALTVRASDANARALYRLLTEHRAVQYVDPLLEAFYADEELDLARVHAVARWLAENAADREPVKVGMALLGAIRGGDDRGLLLTLGRHDELTLYAAVALQRAETPERALLELAKSVDGWGRIQLVERLAETEDEQVRAWMLREGYRNTVMYEYTALPCAVAGDLVGALRLPAPDDALMRGAAALLSTLIQGRDGPAASIGDYPDGAEAAELYLRHLRGRDFDLRELVDVQAIRAFVDEPEGEARDPVLGWPARRDAIAALADAVLARPEWEGRIRAGLESPDHEAFFYAAQARRGFGQDPWEAYFARVERGDGEALDWWHLMRTDDPERIDHVLRLAEARLPLERIASGPADELGMGEGWEMHSALDMVLSGLDRFPGRGWTLIRAGLRSPAVRCRNMAARALAAWDRAAWPADAEPLVRQALAEEPVDGTRDWLQRLLAGEPLEEVYEEDEEDVGWEEDGEAGRGG